MVAQYNALLITQWPLDHTKLSVLPGNEARYETCQRHLDIKHPSCECSTT